MAVYILNAILAVACTWLAWRLFDLHERLNGRQMPDFAYIEGVSGIIDAAESYDAPHALGMAREAEGIARRLGIDEKGLVSLRMACLLHDCGMLNIARDIIKKAGTLDAEELFILRMHPIIGELAIRRSVPPFEDVPSLIRWHHEKFDGTGYPDRLMGDEIPLVARILSLSDAVVAMRSDRPYRPALDEETIRAEIGRQSGLQFDPAVVRAFLEGAAR
ncbi:MAG TPA: HD domain-containing phosphohydrolase [Candidatus Ozemobacteraceae bacterium]|nr:HD domain-containing phosphohydrolase [Candidatus Ozemobacteraceae bacterium]